MCVVLVLVDPSLLSPCGHRACPVLTVKYLYDDDDDDDDDGLSKLPCNLPPSKHLAPEYCYAYDKYITVLLLC